MKSFIKNIIATFTTLAMVLVMSGGLEISQALAQGFNNEINYQGKLTDSSGSTVADGDYDITFRLYDGSSTSSTMVWDEVRATSGGDGPAVSVSSGLFSVRLGRYDSIANVNFNDELWLSVEVENDGEMTPLKKLTSVPSAIEAENAQTLGGIATSSFLRSDQAEALQATSSGTLFQAIQNGAGEVARFVRDSVVALIIDENGNVGIGTSTPRTRLDIDGNVILSGNSRYINFDNATGSVGYGIRDNNGTLEIKNDGGSWENIATGGGEINTASNIGSGVGIFAQKNGVDLEFKSLVAGSNISFSTTSNEITITATDTDTTYTAGAGLNLSGTEFSVASNVILEADIDTEIEFESLLFDVFTPSDGALSDDDLSDDNLDALSNVTITSATSGQILQWNGSAWINANEQDATSSPSGSDGSVQYNNNGAFGGESNFIWDDANNRLGIANGSPATALDVGGTITASGVLDINGSGTSTFAGPLDAGSGTFIVDTSGGQVTLDKDGAQSTGFTINNTSGSLGSSATIALESENATGFLTAYSSSAFLSNFANRVVLDAGSSAGGLDLLASNSTGDIRFYTSGTDSSDERARITSGGNVGIATTSPVSALAVVGTTTIDGNLRVLATGDAIQVGPTDTGIGTSVSGLIFREKGVDILSISNTNGVRVQNNTLGIGGITGDNVTLSASASNILTQSNGGNPQEFRISNTASLSSEFVSIGWINNTNVFGIETEQSGGATVRDIALLGGNVGIGTASPTFTLDVAGTSSAAAFELNGDQITDFTGTNLSVSGGVLSATDTNTTYSAGDLLSLSGTTFNVTGTEATLESVISDATNIFTDNDTIGDANIDDVDTLSTSLTAGSIAFSDGTNLTQDNANLFWDDANNRLGIGTSSPVSTLDIWGDFRVGTSSTPTLFADPATGNVGIGTNNPSIDLAISDTDTGFGVGASILSFYRNNTVLARLNGGNNFQLQNGADLELSGAWISNDGDSEGIRVSDAGNVGIGTTSPTSTLDVWGDLRVGTSSTPTLFADPATGKVGVGTNSPETTLYVEKNSSSGSSAEFPNIEVRNTSMSTGSLSGVSLSAAGETVAGGLIADGLGNTTLTNNTAGIMLYTFSNSALLFGANNTEIARFSSSGNFGINDTNPSDTLSVDGTAGITGDVSAGSITVSGDTINDFTGTNLSVSGGVLSATDTTYTAGDLLSLSGTTFNVAGTEATLESVISDATNIFTNNDTIGDANIADVETLSTSLTAGSIVFSDGTNLTQDNANLYWDNANNRLGIGTSSPSEALEVSGNIEISSDANSFMIGGQNVLSVDITNQGVAVGQQSNLLNSSAIFGRRAASGASGSNIVAIGDSALYSAGASGGAVAIGYEAGRGGVGQSSVSVGRQSSAVGVNSIAVGYDSLAGEDSIALGREASTTAANQLTIGSNTNVDGAITEAYIGRNTTNPYPLIYANTTGLGIGTTTPVSALSVVGDGYFTGSLTAADLVLNNSAQFNGTTTIQADGPAVFVVQNTSGQNLIEADTQNGRFVVRQPGGTAGTNELQMWHDGDQAYINNPTDPGAGRFLRILSEGNDEFEFRPGQFAPVGGANLGGNNPGRQWTNIYFTGDFLDPSNNEFLAFNRVGSPVNHLQISNAATGNGPTLSAVGDDTNIDLLLSPKGSGNVGIGTSSPLATLDVWGDLRVGTSSTPTLFADPATGNVGIGTNNPSVQLELSKINPQINLVNESGNHTANIRNSYGKLLMRSDSGPFFAVGDTKIGVLSGFINTDFQTVLDDGNGNAGFGTSSPWAKLSVAGTTSAERFVATAPSATSSFAGGLTVDGGAVSHSWQTGITSIDNIQLGAQVFGTNAGIVSWIDLPVTAAASAGTAQSYTAQIDGNSLLTIFAESDGSGGIQNSGVGIGTTSPTSTLDVWGDLRVGTSTATTTLVANTATTRVGIGTAAPAYKLDVTRVGDGAVAGFTDTNGTCTIDPTSTSLSCSSDERLKKNITTLSATTSLHVVSALNPVTFQWKTQSTDEARFGFIAQEVEEILPEAVSESANGYKSVSYNTVIPFLVTSIQELDDRLAGLGIQIENGVAQFKRLFASELRTDKLCVGETCVDEQQLKQLLDESESKKSKGENASDGNDNIMDGKNKEDTASDSEDSEGTDSDSPNTGDVAGTSTATTTDDSAATSTQETDSTATITEDSEPQSDSEATDNNATSSDDTAENGTSTIDEATATSTDQSSSEAGESASEQGEGSSDTSATDTSSDSADDGETEESQDQNVNQTE